MASSYQPLIDKEQPVIGYPSVLPIPAPPQLALAPGQWHFGLCSCCTDLLTCQHCQLHIETCFCPCVTFGRIAEMVDDGGTPCPNAAAIWYILEMFTLMGCIYSCWYRQRLRQKYGIPGTLAVDSLVHLCCPMCAFCQEFKELEARGMNPGMGYPLGLNREAHVMTLPPQPVVMTS